MKLFALTGGIGCGKSTVVRELRASHDVTVLDSDEIAHALQRPGTAGYAQTAARWPAAVAPATGLIDRDKLGTIVFADTDVGRASRRALDAIMMPLLARQILCELCALWVSVPAAHIVVVDAPILLEMKRRIGFLVTLPFSGVVVVTCTDPALQHARLVARGDGCTPAVASLRIAAQMPLKEKERLADFVVRNDGSIDELRAKVGAAAAWMRGQSTALNGWNRFVAIVVAAAAALVGAVGGVVWRLGFA